MAFFTNARAPPVPQNTSRVDSSTRPSTRPSAVDFDRVPSPRPRTSLGPARRKSMANGTAPGPSSLSRTTTDLDPNSSPDRMPPNESGMDGNFEDDPQGSSIRNSSPQQTSFLQMDQDDDEDTDTVQDMEETPVRPSKTRKGKERAQDSEQDQQEDHEVEREIAQGLEDVEFSHHSDTEMNAPPPTKPAKMAHEKPKRTRGKKLQPPERSRMSAHFYLDSGRLIKPCSDTRRCPTWPATTVRTT